MRVTGFVMVRAVCASALSAFWLCSGGTNRNMTCVLTPRQSPCLRSPLQPGIRHPTSASEQSAVRVIPVSPSVVLSRLSTLFQNRFPTLEGNYSRLFTNKSFRSRARADPNTAAQGGAPAWRPMSSGSRTARHRMYSAYTTMTRHSPRPMAVDLLS